MIGFTRPHLDSKFLARKGQFITGKKCATNNSLAVNFRSIGAAEIANEKQSIGANDQTMHFRNAGRFKADIAQIVLATNKRHVTSDLDRFPTTFNRNQMRSHGTPFSFSRTKSHL